MRERQDDLENRSRRNNLLFYGLDDTAGETWAESEERILTFCSEKLSVDASVTSIERAHRLGRFSQQNNRPIIVKYVSFKEKQRVLAAARKLKGTDYSISEDYSEKVRLERKKLLQFARERGGDFKLNFNKLKIGTQVFRYDAASDSVKCNVR